MARSALKSLRDGTLAGKREQEILTPDTILTPLLEEWGEIRMDPCAARIRSIAAISLSAPDRDGLALPWVDRTYANPPYAALRVWLEKAVHEAAHGRRIAMLCPVRTHRTWYRDALNSCSAAIELPPVTFSGYKQPFPAPLHLLCWGWVPLADRWGSAAVRSTARLSR